jgi:3-deoxy-manno-octulosonate cytidylyltransferase (CMP-KDO synthetase)
MLDNPEILVTNLIGDIETIDEFEDRNCIKVVCDLNSNALCFSREPIPTRKFGDVTMKKQVCIIPFRREFLLEYTDLSPTPLEIAESVDMMRVLEHGLKVKMIPTRYVSHAVDTLSDLHKVENFMNKYIVS